MKAKKLEYAALCIELLAVLNIILLFTMNTDILGHTVFSIFGIKWIGAKVMYTMLFMACSSFLLRGFAYILRKWGWHFS